MRLIVIVLLVLLGGGLIWLLVPWPPSPREITETGDPKRGEYVLYLSGCVACHTDSKNGGKFLAGGRALETPFGTFYTPNITPDPKSGIGGSSTGDFVAAMTEGIGPGGHPLYPAFPYPSYTRMTEQDLVDLKAYLDTVEPVDDQVPGHQLRFPYGFRPALKIWRLLFFRSGTFQPDPSKSDSWNRGAYIVNGPGHCGECHTPRKALGAPELDRFLAGTRAGPYGKAVPNITPNKDSGIGTWSKTDVTFALQTGILPNGDVLGGAMAEEIKDATSHWSAEDRAAVAEYLLSLPPLEGPPRAASPSSSIY
jgi:mono/diheme cytochrome c family protein